MLENNIAKPYYATQCKRLKEIRKNEKYKAFGIEWTVRVILQFAAIFVPSGLVKCLSNGQPLLTRRKHIEMFAFAKVLLAYGLVRLGLANSFWVLLIIIILCLDTLHALLSRIFLDFEWREVVSYKRNMIMVFVNYIEVVLCFAAIYQYCDNNQDLHQGAAFVINNQISVGTSHLTPVQVIYFSFITAATIGYGDISPSAGLVQNMVTLQVIVSLFFIVVIVGNVMANLGNDGFLNRNPNSTDPIPDDSKLNP